MFIFWCKIDKNIKWDGLRYLLKEHHFPYWLHVGLQYDPDWNGSQGVSRAASFTKGGLPWGQTRLFRALARRFFRALKDVVFRTWSLSHCLATITVKMVLPTPFRNLLCSCWCTLLLIFPPCTPAKCLALSSSESPGLLKGCFNFLLSNLFSRLNQPSFLSLLALFITEQVLLPLTSFVIWLISREANLGTRCVL